MTTTATPYTRWREHAAQALASARAAAWAHAASIVLGAAVLLFVGRNQWFFFDEWDFIWQPEGLRRLVEGHNGHWSLIPIGIWLALQNTLGLGSYLPYLVVAILAHLVLAHLLWRLLRRIGCHPWIATALIAVFILLGSATENLMWAFQLGFMGAIALVMGALLIVSRPELRMPAALAAAGLLTLGAATSGTALPFFIAVAAVVFFRHGWRSSLLVLAPPVVIYLFWYLLLAGENPTAIYRATGVGNSLQGIPHFMARMFVDGLNTVTPVPSFGIVLLTAIAVWVLVRIRGRAGDPELIAYGMLASGIAFAALTAYSRLAIGPNGVASARYVYVVVIAILPAVAIMLTALVGRSSRALLATGSLLAVVFVYNLGMLITTSYVESDRERHTQALFSAAAALAEEYPEAVDRDARPDPVYVPRSLDELLVLEERFGLARSAYSPSDTLAALLNVGTTVSPATADDCERRLEPGERIEVSPVGVVLQADPGTRVTVAAAEGDAVSPDGEIVLDEESVRVVTAFDVTLVVRGSTAPVLLCNGTSR